MAAVTDSQSKQAPNDKDEFCVTFQPPPSSSSQVRPKRVLLLALCASAFVAALDTTATTTIVLILWSSRIVLSVQKAVVDESLHQSESEHPAIWTPVARAPLSRLPSFRNASDQIRSALRDCIDRAKRITTADERKHTRVDNAQIRGAVYIQPRVDNTARILWPHRASATAVVYSACGLGQVYLRVSE